jgi:hypothetical protein
MKWQVQQARHYERIAARPADPTLGIVRSLLF